MGGGIIRGTKNFYEVKDMKAKRILSVLFAAAMSATLCAGLAGCGEEKDSGQKQPDTLVMPEKLVSEKVTEAEWGAAFNEASFSNAKIIVSGQQEYVNGEDKTETDVNTVLTMAEGTEHYKGTINITGTVDGKEEKETDAVEWYSVKTDEDCILL